VEKSINDIIRERRSIYPKEYNGQLLDPVVIDTLLQNANFAPNHKGNYPWRFVVIGDGLADWLNEAARIYELEAAEKFSAEKKDKILAYAQQVSHAIAIVMKHEPEDRTIFMEDVCAVAAGVQNMYLSLSQFEHAAGYWSTGLGTYSPHMHMYLGLESSETLLGFFILGSVDVKRTAGNRKDYKQFIRTL